MATKTKGVIYPVSWGDQIFDARDQLERSWWQDVLRGIHASEDGKRLYCLCRRDRELPLCVQRQPSGSFNLKGYGNHATEHRSDCTFHASRYRVTEGTGVVAEEGEVPRIRVEDLKAMPTKLSLPYGLGARRSPAGEEGGARSGGRSRGSDRYRVTLRECLLKLWQESAEDGFVLRSAGAVDEADGLRALRRAGERLEVSGVMLNTLLNVGCPKDLERHKVTPGLARLNRAWIRENKKLTERAMADGTGYFVVGFLSPYKDGESDQDGRKPQLKISNSFKTPLMRCDKGYWRDQTQRYARELARWREGASVLVMAWVREIRKSDWASYYEVEGEVRDLGLVEFDKRGWRPVDVVAG